MIRVKYFKTSMWGDCYVADDNYMKIISISNKNLCIVADDEGIFGGAYKEIYFPEEDFEKMKNFTMDNERENLMRLLKKIHQENKNFLDISENPFIKVKINTLTGDKKLERAYHLRNYFFKTKSILN